MIGLFITDAGRAAIGTQEDQPDQDHRAGTATDTVTAVASPGDDAGLAAGTTPSRVSKPQTKAAMLLSLLQQPHGATLDELVGATGWLPHTARAALTGLRKKGHALTSEKVNGLRHYRIVADTIQASGAQ